MSEKLTSEQLQKLEALLAKSAYVTEAQSFPKWEEIENKPLKYPDLEPQVAVSKVIAFPKRGVFWFGSGLLAAASLGFVFYQSYLTPELSVASIASGTQNEKIQTKYLPLSGRMLFVKGNNFVIKSESSDPIALTKAYQIGVGDKIIVSKAGIVDLEFENKIWVRILGETDFEIIESKVSDSSSLQLTKILKGKVLFNIGKLKKDSIFQVASGDIETTVRGTTFSVYYDGENSQTIAVREGVVEVKSRNSVTVLEASQQITILDQNVSAAAILLPKEAKELKALLTQVTLSRENRLYEEFSRLELVKLEDGTELRGVIMGQSGTFLQFEGIDGKIEIPIERILETEKIR